MLRAGVLTMTGSPPTCAARTAAVVMSPTTLRRAAATAICSFTGAVALGDVSVPAAFVSRESEESSAFVACVAAPSAWIDTGPVPVSAFSSVISLIAAVTAASDGGGA